MSQEETGRDVVDRWTIRGIQYVNCNCSWGCPCQFGAKTTHGYCEGIAAGHLEEGSFNDTSLDGLDWVLLVSWPGEIAEGNGTEQVIIDSRADAAQREALRKILHGEATAPGATHFYVYNSTMSHVLDTLYLPIDLSIDVDARTASVTIADLIESIGAPVVSKFSGIPRRMGVRLPDGFEYSYAEMGNASTTSRAGVHLDLKDSYGQFNLLHMNQDGIIR